MSTLLTMSNELSWAMVFFLSAGCDSGRDSHYQFPPSGCCEHYRDLRQLKQPVEVSSRRSGDLFGLPAHGLGQHLRRPHHKGGLVAHAAIGSGREPGSISFDKDSIERHLGRHIAKILRLGISEIAGERNKKTHVERPPRLLPTGPEAVHDAAQGSSCPMLLENQEEIVPRVGGFVCAAAMDQDGPLARGGNLELADQSLVLHPVRRAFVIVIEPDLAAG